jgi:anaerobic dimethyl sulfoxide reductase subunit B (iron-sulfur subunit)
MQLGFYIDTSACSGCKACQVACKDTHDLEQGRLWRRVATIESGAWVRQGAAWTTTVVAYSVPMSCMHCERPVCVEGCPTGAMRKGEDGVVTVAEHWCIGCRYCEWVCPYGAPRYDERTGRMTKCDFCRDERDAGRPPVCVAACPMRALDFGDLDQLRQRYGAGCSIYPLPDGSLTMPSLVLKPHPDSSPVASGLPAGAKSHQRVGNREEL